MTAEYTAGCCFFASARGNFANILGISSLCSSGLLYFGNVGQLLSLQGLGGMNFGNPEQMQQAMSQMMNNPMMQSVLNDPEMLRNMFSSNPAIQQVSGNLLTLCMAPCVSFCIGAWFYRHDVCLDNPFVFHMTVYQV